MLLLDKDSPENQKKKEFKLNIPKLEGKDIKKGVEYAGKGIKHLGSTALKGAGVVGEVKGVAQDVNTLDEGNVAEKVGAGLSLTQTGAGTLEKGAKLAGGLLDKAGKEGAKKVVGAVSKKAGEVAGSSALGGAIAGVSAVKGITDIVSGDVGGGFQTGNETASQVLSTAGSTLTAGATLAGAGGTGLVGAATAGGAAAAAATAGGAGIAGAGMAGAAAGLAALGPVGWAGLAIGGTAAALGLMS